jgi:DNA-binding transcriptional LysR family regulator
MHCCAPRLASCSNCRFNLEIEACLQRRCDLGTSCRRAADRKRIRIADIGSAKAQTAFVRAGLDWSIVSEVAARESAAAGRLDLRLLDPPLFRDLVLVWRAERATRPVIAAALAVFSSHAGDQGVAGSLPAF